MIVEIAGTLLMENIRYLRKRYALSYRALARLLGMSEIILHDLEEGRGLLIMKENELKRLCAIFDTDLRTLFHTDMSENQTM